MSVVLFITHGNVAIDPDVPVPDWGLSDLGRSRHRAFNSRGTIRRITAIYTSAERKARDGAAILAEAIGIAPVIVEALHENDRSATGFLPPTEFEQVADRFFARPDEHVRGWESARDAQRRIKGVVDYIMSSDGSSGDIAIVAHGAVGALLLCDLQGVAISREWDQPGIGGGNWFAFDRRTRRLKHGWQPIDS